MMADSLDTLLDTTLASSSVGSPQDALVAAVHSCLVSAGYSLVTIGDENFDVKPTEAVDTLASGSSPALLKGWNSSQDTYALQYRHKATQQLCLVKAILMEGQLLVNAMASCDMGVVHTVALDISNYIRDEHEQCFNSTSVFRNLLQLMSVLSKEVESKLSQTCEMATVAQSPLPSSSSKRPDVAAVTRPRVDEGLGDDPLRIGPPRHPGRPMHDRDLDPLMSGPFGYGEADRTPLGMGGPSGGGMIFDPLRQGGRMGGGIPGFGPQGPFPPTHPHGARYDPVYPIGPGPRPRPPGRTPARGFGEPDPDHLPPPGYDDMFS